MSAPISDSAGIRQTVRALKVAGLHPLYVFDGGENVKTKTETEVVEAVTAVDDAYLYVSEDGVSVAGWVRFVLGNSPEEVICDHTIGLSHVLDPLTEGWN